MRYSVKLAALVLAAMVPCSAVWAQVEGEATIEVPTDSTMSPTPTTTTPTPTTITPSGVPVVTPGSNTTPGVPGPSPSASGTLDTTSGQAFLSSLATKFGTSVSRLQSLLDKLPPKGRGLNRFEVTAISSKLGLTPEEKEVFRSRVSGGGTGFTQDDVAGMGVRLGLSDVEVARLSQELGLTNPAVATPYPATLTPTPLPVPVKTVPDTSSPVPASIPPSTMPPEEPIIEQTEPGM